MPPSIPNNVRHINPEKRPSRVVELLVIVSIFFGAFMIFIGSPVRSLGETQYTMVVANRLLHQRTFVLSAAELRLPDHPEMIGNTAKVKKLPLEIVNSRIYKYAPPGSAVLSIPFVVLAGTFGLTPFDGNDVYDPMRELTMSSILAALLMGAFAVVCFQTLRLMLSFSLSLAITVAATLGSQVWSTASRVVEPDTWTVLLLMMVLYLLIAHELRKHKFRPVLLASLLSWCYFVHPTTAISIIVITAYVWFYQRAHFFPLALTGLAWLLLLLAYSWHNFGQLLPNYFQASRLGFETFWEALPGNVISPSRGLLVYVPVLSFVAFCLARYRAFVPLRHLVVSGVIVVVVHLIVISGFSHWWAGHSYGPRYWTSLIPWLVFLSAAGVKGMITYAQQNGRSWSWTLQVATATLLAFLGVAIHARGALAQETYLWNSRPYDIDLRAGRLWNWHYPQFLAGLIYPPLPDGAYSPAPMNQRIDFSTEAANRFVWYGWSDPEPLIRWSEAKSAAIVFRFDGDTDLNLIMRAAPFVIKGLNESQRVMVKLNGEAIQSMELKDGSAVDFSLSLSRAFLKRDNVLLFDLPDAKSPARLGLSSDPRQLGIAVQWFEFTPAADTRNSQF